ncbi:MAG: hypothetical protein KGI75_00865, partial [Rhizobiaceae bacterium]|nr:hypothetical protein [Rhizobiaceae bacterium]
MLFGGDYRRAADAALGVLLGQPHWRTFQARVLGPWLVDVLSSVMPSFLAAHIAFSLLTLWAMGFLSWRLGWRLGSKLGAGMLGLFVFQASFAFILSPPWLYAWDYVDIIVFLLFVDFVVGGRSWPWFVVLLSVGVYSRETSAFIALWMVLEGAYRLRAQRTRTADERRHDLGMLIAGLVCMVLSVVIFETITRMLFIQEIGPKIFSDVPGEG